MIGYRLLAAILALILLTAAGELPATLRRGINITHWFRFPPRRDPTALRDYLDDAALAELKVPASPSCACRYNPTCCTTGRTWPGDGEAAAARLSVIVVAAPTDWHLETSPAIGRGYCHLARIRRGCCDGPIRP